MIPAFADFCGGAVLIGHFLSLDIPFLDKACVKHIGGIIQNPLLDTMKLAEYVRKHDWKILQKRYNKPASLNLAELSGTYRLPQFRQHDALSDAIQTAYLFLFLIQNLRSSGIESFDKLYAIGRYRRSII